MYTTSVAIALAATLAASAAMPQIGAPGKNLKLSFNVRKASTLEAIDNTIEKRGTYAGGVKASPVSASNSKYLVPIRVGTQDFDIKIDTGSGTFWLLSNLMPSASQGTNHAIYTPGPSASSINKSFDASYLDGSGGKGVGYADNVVFGGATIVSQVVGAATSASSNNNPGAAPTDANSGMLGLSYGPIQNAYPSPGPAAFMTSLNQQLAQPLFTLDLQKDSTGRMDIGYIDSAKYSGAISWVARDTASSTAWKVAPGKFYINGTASTANLASLAWVDSGTTLLIAPQAVVDQYYANVPNATASGSSYYFPCSNVAKDLLPSFGIDLGGTTFTIPGRYMWWAHHGSANCWGAMTGTTGSTATLGDMFHRTQFVVYDYTGRGRLGFASKAALQAAPLP